MSARVRQTAALALALLTGVGLGGCDRNDAPVAPPADGGLVLVRAVALAVPEPSDLCLDRDGVHAWTVSDNTGLVYKLRLSDGVVVTTLAYHGTDPEGIWQDPGDGTLYVAEEGTREIVHLDAAGAVLGRVAVEGLGGDANSGLEGITFNSVTHHFYVVQEKSPVRLVEVDAAGNVVALHDVDYVADLSGVTYDAVAGQLLLVSDDSHEVCRATLSGTLVSAWDIDVQQPEGIALDTAHGRIYVVSDSGGTLYEFQAP